MTSSLVGSEMCIRDRCPPRQRVAALRFSRATQRRVFLAARTVCFNWLFSCLLYTSDAADDM
eukprot:9019456-Prorocentrum_lima.AAC.1